MSGFMKRKRVILLKWGKRVWPYGGCTQYYIYVRLHEQKRVILLKWGKSMANIYMSGFMTEKRVILVKWGKPVQVFPAYAV